MSAAQTLLPSLRSPPAQWSHSSRPPARASTRTPPSNSAWPNSASEAHLGTIIASMALNEDLDRIAQQERELVLPRLDAQTAWELGSRLRALAAERALAVVIDIRRFGQPLFYAAMDATTPDNVEWVRRKSNVVAHFHSSSYVAGLKEKLKNQT